MRKPVVYILQSSKNTRYYVGSTIDLDKRLEMHNSGLVSATKNMRPLAIVAFVECEDITEAKSSEYRLKKYKRRDILEKVILDKMFPWNYKRRV